MQEFFFFLFNLTVNINLVEEAYNLKQVSHLQYDLSVKPVEVLLSFSLIS